MATCPNCGNETSEGAVFCDRCGTRLPEALAPATPPPATVEPAGGTVICPACGAGNVPGEAFCDYCGSPLEAPMPTVAPPAAPETEAAVPAAPAPAPDAPVAPPPALEGEAVPAVPAVPPAENICPACGAAVLPNEAFCANCGASLAQAPIPPEPVVEAEPVVPAPEPVIEVEPVASAPEPVVAVEPVTPAPEPVAAPPPVAPPAPAAGPNCPACGAQVESGDTFCSSCGFTLQAKPQPAAPAPVPAPVPVPAPAAATGARLVVSASGAEIPLPPGDELLIGREDPVSGIYPEVDLTPHGGEEGGVSRRHARIMRENDDYYVEDLDSTNFTFVNKQKVAPKTRQRIVDGDEIRAGRVALVFHK